MNSVLNMWRKMSAYPGGKRVFSKMICLKAPYFSTISPQFEALDVGSGVVRIRERRALHNHIGTVHAIALCNLAEVVGGITAEVSVPKGMRWIPAGMTVRYLKPAKGVLRGYATMREIEMGEKGEVPVIVEVQEADGTVVFTAEIGMHVSPAKPKK